MLQFPCPLGKRETEYFKGHIQFTYSMTPDN